MSFDKAAYQREYMARKRAESNILSNKEGEMLDKPVRQVSGTTVAPPTYSAEVWTEAYRRIQEGKARERNPRA